MTASSLLVGALVLFGYGLISARLSARMITAPMAFVAFGLVLGDGGLGVIESRFDETSVEFIAEATLVLVLFADATRIDLSVLRRQIELPSRLLGIGLPLSILAGGVVAGLLIDGITAVEGFLIGAILAPTDAALGQAVVSDRAVPVRVRQALNVESGLNDGIALPVVAALAALAVGENETTSSLLVGAGGEILFGVLIGIAVGYIGGLAIRVASERHAVEGVARQLATLAVPAIAFAATQVLIGNGFIAAFVAGLAFGHTGRTICESAAEFTEDLGQLLTWFTFLLFGATLVPVTLERVTWQMAVYAALSLTVIRVLPVAVGAIGAGLDRTTVLFLGWFGPRGLASMLFALLILEDHIAGESTVIDVVVLTVLASVVLHGASARPFARRYGETIAERDGMEHEEVEEMRSASRGGLSQS